MCIRDRLVGARAPVALALFARRLDDLPLALAGGTRCDGDELPEERALRATHLSVASTGLALMRPGSGLRSAARAGFAGVEHLDPDLLLDTRRHVNEGERHRDLDVGATGRTATALTTPEEIVQAAEAAEALGIFM